MTALLPDHPTVDMCKARERFTAICAELDPLPATAEERERAIGAAIAQSCAQLSLWQQVHEENLQVAMAAMDPYDDSIDIDFTDETGETKVLSLRRAFRYSWSQPKLRDLARESDDVLPRGVRIVESYRVDAEQLHEHNDAETANRWAAAGRRVETAPKASFK